MSHQKLNAAHCLRTHQTEIIKLWRDRVVVEVDAAKAQNKAVLLDHLPEFLDDIANVLDPAKGVKRACEETDACELHGLHRALTYPYQIKQVLEEYSILRQVLFSFIETECTLSRQERDSILLSIEKGMQECSASFFHQKTFEIQTDKDVQDKFVSTLSHDLRNPIGAAVMAADLLFLHFEQNQEVKELTQMLKRNLKKAEMMLRDLLDVNMIKSGRRLMMTIGPCNLNEVVKDVLSDLIAIHGQRFHFETDGKVQGFWCCYNLSRAVDNLLTNAVKYGAASKPISVKIFRKDDHVGISIHNHGTPIPLIEQSSLFEPYFRSQAAANATVVGWGLGLSLVRGVAEAHGGKVEVRSTASEGTTFSIVLPMDSRPFQSKETQG